MKLIPTCCLLLFVFITLTTYSQQNISCVIKTSLGDIHLELELGKAPITVNNFMNYVDQDLYKNSSFFRVCTNANEAEREIKIEVIQGGNVREGKEFPPIKLETTEETGLFHKNGTISMARSDPDSATSSFFICINDQPELDYGGKRNPDGQGFAAFGKVTRGMDVIKVIQAQSELDQFLIEPVRIKNIIRAGR